MSLWKRLFGKNTYERPESQSPSGGTGGTMLEYGISISGLQEYPVFVSLQAEGNSFPLYRFELGCGLDSFCSYDKSNTLFDNAMIIVVQDIGDDSSLLEWAFPGGHIKCGCIVWHTDKDDISSTLETLYFEDAVCGSYTKKFDPSLRCGIIEICLIPQIVCIEDVNIKRKSKS